MRGRNRTAKVGLLGCLALMALVPLTARAGDARVLFDFDESGQGWYLLRQNGELPRVPCRSARPTLDSRQRSLAIDMDLPQRCGAGIELPAGQRNWHPSTHLKLRVYCPFDAPEQLQLVTYLKDAELNYYLYEHPRHLNRGNWTEVRIDLTARSEAWEPRGHYKPWDGYCRQNVQEMGVKFVCRTDYEGVLFLDDVELTSVEGALPDENALYNLRVNSETVPLYGKFEISFNLSRTYSNPFDPDVVDVSGVFIAPDGEVVRVPGFFYQGYLRRMDKRAEKLTPMGRTQWKIRFAPRQLGGYHYYVEVHDGEELRSEMGRFRCVESSSGSEGSGSTARAGGFVRVSKRDPYALELSNGDYYYPIGHNIATVQDSRAGNLAVSIPAAEGTYAYDRFLRRMAEHGENLGRVWMTPDGFEIEWTRGRNVHYRGAGRYNLCNAWRLDHLLETARSQGVYLIMVITGPDEVTGFGAGASGEAAEPGRGSPYWDRNGGPLESAEQFYTSKEALELYQQRLRYIGARWGYCPAVMAWEVLNEPDRAAYYQNSRRYARLGAEFLEKAAKHLMSADCGDHLITCSFVRFKSPIAAPLLSLDEIDFTSGAVYAGELEEKLLDDVNFMQEKFGKIFLAIEAGVTPIPQDPEPTVRIIHRTLWASHMMPYAGAAMPWWWELIDRWDLYDHFQALGNFARGEDRRGRSYQSVDAEVTSSSEERQLSIVAVKSSDRARCWVYNRARLSAATAWKEVKPAGATVTIPGLSEGTYSVEIWDTYSGEVIAQSEAESGSGSVTFELPPFEKDIAAKVQRQMPAP